VRGVKEGVEFYLVEFAGGEFLGDIVNSGVFTGLGIKEFTLLN